MYINFKSKYKKIFWVLFVFLLSCVFVHKVYASPIFQTYDFNDFSFNFNNISFNKESLFNMIEQELSSKNKTLDDYQYITISIPTIPKNDASDVRYNFRVVLQNILPISCSAGTGFNSWNCRYNSIDLPSQAFDIYYYFSGSHSSYISSITAYNLPYIFSGNSSTNTMNVYTNYDFSLISISNINNSYTKFYYDPNMLSTEPPLPPYLQGYKKITLTNEDKYVMLSGLSSGSVYVPAQAFEEYGGRLSYYDNDLSSQPYTSYIQDYYKMPDGEFIRQDFDLSQFYGADWVMFSKYVYLEGVDDISYDIYVPNDIYDSLVTITPNPATGGNDFDFDYKDENGNIQSEQVQSVDLSQDNPLLGNIFSDFSSNTFGLTSIITAPLSLIRSLSSTSCTPLNLPLPFVGGTLTLPCMYSFYSSTFGVLFTLYQTITFGIVAYWVMVRIFNMVKDFKNPDHDEIEVVDL